jgi:phytoene dehydrogenase-like protein
MIQAGLYSPPMPVGAQTAMMDQSAEGREIMRTMGMSTFDLMEELFEHDKVKAHFGRVAGENLVSPDEKATGIGAYVFLGFLEKFGFGVPVGGSGSLTDALIACIEDHGGAVRANCTVREVVTDGGRATGRRARQRRAAAVQRRRHRGDPPARAARDGPRGVADGGEERAAHAHHPAACFTVTPRSTRR